MGTTANGFISKAIAQLRKENPEKLKEKGTRIKFSRKQCGECDAPRGTEHAKNCANSGRSVRG